MCDILEKQFRADVDEALVSNPGAKKQNPESQTIGLDKLLGAIHRDYFGEEG